MTKDNKLNILYVFFIGISIVIVLNGYDYLFNTSSNLTAKINPPYKSYIFEAQSGSNVIFTNLYFVFDFKNLEGILTFDADNIGEESIAILLPIGLNVSFELYNANYTVKFIENEAYQINSTIENSSFGYIKHTIDKLPAKQIIHFNISVNGEIYPNGLYHFVVDDSNPNSYIGREGRFFYFEGKEVAYLKLNDYSCKEHCTLPILQSNFISTNSQSGEEILIYTLPKIKHERVTDVQFSITSYNKKIESEANFSENIGISLLVSGLVLIIDMALRLLEHLIKPFKPTCKN